MLFQRDFLDEVERIARIGADQVMRHWRNLDPSQVDEKARNDLVSAADRASEDAILEAIRSSFPDHCVVAEEGGASGSGPGPTWIVDPLDGTNNFVHGFPHFAVSIGVAVDGHVHHGVILDPVKGDTFRSSQGQGAWWNGSRCRVSRRPGLEGAMLATGFPFRTHQLLDSYLAIFRDVFLRCTAIRRPGAAALDLAYTACGIFDGFFEFRLSPWDVAAGALMIEEAGGVVTDMAGGGEFLDSGDLVCGAPNVHRELLARILHHRR